MNDLKKQGKIIWQSPSNIALIKYWGKYANQIPANPSISISLQNCYTQTEINYQYRNQPSGFSDLEFTFENKPEPKFAQRIVTYFESIESEMPFLKQYKLQINSYNTFPHSSGIASSASAMSALALGICTLESIYKNNAELLTESFFNRASYFARLASGSASRSVYGGFALWGKSDSHTESSDLFAMPVNNNISDTFKNMHNSILIVDSAKKELSSSNGHKLMETNPFAKARYQQANANLTKLLTALQSDNFNIFADIIENEALSLHSMMMTSICLRLSRKQLSKNCSIAATASK